MSGHISIFINQLLEVDGPEGPAIHRALHIDDKARQVALFDVTAKKALPIWVDFDELQQGLVSERIRPLEKDRLQPSFTPDEVLSEAAKRTRDERLKVILPLVSPEADPTMPILRAEHRGRMIEEAIAHHGKAKDKIYQWLRLWWRHGQLDNALLPAFGNCGRGPRAPGGAKRGRKLLPTSKSHDEHVGVSVDDRMRKLILRGQRMFWNAKHGGTSRTKQDAYQLTLQSFFHKRLELKDGVLTAIVREGVEDDNRLPTFDQWDYHVEKHLKEQGVLVGRYNKREMALRRRPVLGSSEHLSKGPGDLFLIDATVADVYLLSSYDRRWVIGRPILYLVVDHYSRMVVGMHVALEGPNWTGAMMALANAFTDKVAFCAKYGIDIKYEDWPCDVAPARLTADRGEVISKHADYIVPGFRMAIHDTPPFRADFKSFVEGQFKITNEKGIKRMPGWVDKLKGRGGRDYRLDATFDLAAFTEMMIRLVLHNNRTRGIKSNVPLNFPFEAGQDPVPLELWDWGLSNASPSIRRFELEDVRRNLLPTFDAVHTRNGLSVLGGRLHYTLPRAISEGWFVKAPNRGGKVEKIALDPWDVSKAYLRGPNGALEECELIPADVRLFAGRTLADVEDWHDRQKQRKKGNERRRIQDDTDINAQVDAIKERTAQQRRDELNGTGRSKPDVSSIKPMRAAERDVERLANASSKQTVPASPPVPEPTSTPPPMKPEADTSHQDEDGEDHIFMPD